MSRPFPRNHPGHDVPAMVQSKSPKPHLLVSAQCGRPECDCQQNEADR